jgi:hypothetical protein
MMALKKNDSVVLATEVNTEEEPTLAIYKKPRIPTPGIAFNEMDLKKASNTK